MSDIVIKMKDEIIKRSNEFENKTKGTKDEYNLYKEHIQYVFKYAILIAKNKNVDTEVVELSALLHDIAMTDTSLDRSKHNEYGSEIAGKLLEENKYPREKIELVKKCILNHSSKRQKYRTTEEERILVNADAMAHFDCIESIYSLAHNVMGLSEKESIQFLKDKLTKDFNEIDDDVKNLIQNKYNYVMNIKSENEVLSMNELIDIYHRNFPNIVREENTIKRILSNPGNHIIEKRNNEGKLIGVSVINKNTILLLCVDKEYRKKGIGTKLLNESEKYILNNGFDKLNIGVGYDYLTPGVPINDETVSFFVRRYYTHSWGENECFDMDMNLSDVVCEYNLDDIIDGIKYRLATVKDIENIKKCTNDAHQEFTKYYENEALYNLNSDQIVLVAEDNGIICGTLIISKETEAPNMGSVGCTTTKPNYQRRGIATNMVKIGTKYLRDIGLKYGHLGYTYSGLDKMYGKAGYKISTKYMMAEKPLVMIKDNDFNFRKIKKEEFDILRHSFNDTDELWDKYKTMRMKQYDENDVDTYIVELNNKVVGEVTVNYSSHDLSTEAIPNQRVYIQAFRIEPSYQGYGLGQKLMDYTLTDLENKGIIEFTIGVEDDNEVAKYIYFKYGFTQEIDHGKGDVFDPTDYTLYMKSTEKKKTL